MIKISISCKDVGTTGPCIFSHKNISCVCLLGQVWSNLQSSTVLTMWSSKWEPVSQWRVVSIYTLSEKYMVQLSCIGLDLTCRWWWTSLPSKGYAMGFKDGDSSCKSPTCFEWPQILVTSTNVPFGMAVLLWHKRYKYPTGSMYGTCTSCYHFHGSVMAHWIKVKIPPFCKPA